METLELSQMEQIEGGQCSKATKAIAIAGGTIACGFSFSVIGALIAGPTCLALIGVQIYCS
jgi:hypothetical protein